MYNPEGTKLAQRQVAPVFAVLQTFDGALKYSFLVNPKVAKDHQMVLASLPVLGTTQPLVRYKSSVSTVSLSECRFITQSGDRDLSEVLARLTSWVRPDKDQGVPKLLKFTWGSLSVPRVYLTGFRYDVIQTRQGYPVEASGSMELTLAPEVPVLRKEATGGANLTIREQGEKATEVTELLKKDKKKAAKYNLATSDKVSVTSDGIVTAQGSKGKPRVLGKLSEVLK